MGCNHRDNNVGGLFDNNLILILLVLFCCFGNGFGNVLGSDCGNVGGLFDDNNLIFILLILFCCCGNGFGFGF